MLNNVIFYCEYLICNKKDKLGTGSPLYKAVIFCVLSKNLQVRNKVKDLLIKFGQTDKGVEIILELISEYMKYINNIDLKVNES